MQNSGFNLTADNAFEVSSTGVVVFLKYKDATFSIEETNNKMAMWLTREPGWLRILCNSIELNDKITRDSAISILAEDAKVHCDNYLYGFKVCSSGASASVRTEYKKMHRHDSC